MDYYIKVWAQGDFNNEKGTITSVKQGTFHYNSTNGSVGKFKFGNVCSAYCEFDYYTDGAITLNVGDMFDWRYDTTVDKQFNDTSGGGGVTASDPGGTGDVSVTGMTVTDDGSGNLTVSNSIGITDDGNGNLTVPGASTVRTIIGDNFFVVSTKTKKNICHVIGYDPVYSLDVDYSARLKQLKSSFPMTINDLFEDVCNYCGCGSTSFRNLDLMGSEQVNYFYVEGITGREIIRAIAETLAYDVVGRSDAIFPKDIIVTRAIGGHGVQPEWNDTDTYVICPGDGTYYQPDSVTLATNVWYKENSLDIMNAETMYDGVEYVSSSGVSLGHYYNTVSPQNIYFISNNIILDNIDQDGMLDTFDNYAQALYEGSQNVPSLVRIFPYAVATVDIFPFRCPYKRGNMMTRLVDTDGTYYNLPIMSLDITNERVRIESYGEEAGSGDGSGGGAATNSETTTLWSKLNGLIKTKNVTGTTNSGGNISAGLNGNFIIVSAKRTDATSVCTPLWGTAGTTWFVHVATNAGDAVANTNVTLEVAYYSLT